ncbi:MAG: hypothetical protein L3J53_02845 [Proteobacteria bacterium]|nr:hypothetical protein [Pseudomonadota bacterium]
MTLLDEAKTAINKCNRLLNEISTTCCMPERSPNMHEAFTQIDNILENLDLALHSNDNVHKAIADIGRFGSMIGYLYATCCTDIREPLYQKMYKQMNSAHGNLWRHMGHSH